MWDLSPFLNNLVNFINHAFLSCKHENAILVMKYRGSHLVFKCPPFSSKMWWCFLTLNAFAHYYLDSYVACGVIVSSSPSGLLANVHAGLTVLWIIRCPNQLQYSSKGTVDFVWHWHIYICIYKMLSLITWLISFSPHNVTIRSLRSCIKTNGCTCFQVPHHLCFQT